MRWFYFKMWFRRMRFIHIKRLYIIFQLLQNSDVGEYDLKLGISYNSKKYYSKDSYSPRLEYKRKAREIRIHFLVGYIAFGYWGKKQEKTIGENKT